MATDILYKLISLFLVLQLFSYEFLKVVFPWSFKGQILAWDFFIRFTPDRIVFFLIIVVFVTKRLLRNDYKKPIDKLETCMIIFTIICTISYLIAKPDLGLEKHRNLTTLLNLTYIPFITYFIVRRIPVSKEGRDLFLKTILLIGCYLSLTAIFEHFKINALVWPKYILDPNVGLQFGRSRGPFVETAEMGRALNIALLTTFLILTNTDKTKKIILYIFSFFLIVGIYFTYTRGPWIGVGLALTALIFSRTELRKVALIALCITFLGIASGYGSKLSIHGKSLFSRRKNTIENRYVAMGIAKEMAIKNPLFGIGFGKYDQQWPDYVPDNAGSSFDFDGNHNTFLGIVAEVGIVGLIPYMILYYFIFKMFIKLYKRWPSTMNMEKDIILITIAVIITHLFTALLVDTRFNPFTNTVVFLFCAIVSQMNSQREALNTNNSVNY